MNLRELVEKLSADVEEYGDCEVYLAKDAEGNGFHSIHEWTSEPELEVNYDDEQVENVVVIWPI